MTELVTTIADSSYPFAILERLSFRRPVLFQHGVYQDLDVKSIGFNSQVMTCHLSHLRFPCTEIHGPVDRPKGVDPGLFARRLLGLCLEATGFFGETQTTKSLFFWKITKKWLVVFFTGKNDYKETVWEMICFFLRHWMIGHHTWPSWKPRWTRSGHWWGRKRPPRGAVFSWGIDASAWGKFCHNLLMLVVLKKCISSGLVVFFLMFLIGLIHSVIQIPCSFSQSQRPALGNLWLSLEMALLRRSWRPRNEFSKKNWKEALPPGTQKGWIFIDQQLCLQHIDLLLVSCE